MSRLSSISGSESINYYIFVTPVSIIYKTY